MRGSDRENTEQRKERKAKSEAEREREKGKHLKVRPKKERDGPWGQSKETEALR